ncbi:MAG: hypothetical protein WBF73_22545, partial [Bradyrhizobium sp.]
LETNNSASRYRKKKTEKTILLILRSRTFSHSLGQKRRFGDVPVTSALPPKADIHREVRHVRSVPTTEMRGDYQPQLDAM